MIREIKASTDGLVSVSGKLTANMSETTYAKDNIAENISKVENNITEQVHKMENLAKGMGVFTISINNLSETVESEATAVAESSASIEEMIANISMVTKNVNHTSNIIEELDTEAARGGELIDQVSKEIGAISEQSSDLQEANELITSIASQTNLLAMNAAIEAAHAGDAGKGFAVVADEIRRLAETSGQQSQTIAQNINSILYVIKTVVNSASDTETAFSQINDKIKTAIQLQETIKNAMAEQTQGSTEILEAIASLNEDSQIVNRESSQMASTGKEMNAMVQEINTATNYLFNSIEEMAVSVNKIETAINQFLTLGEENGEYITILSERTSRFKLN